MQAVTTIGLDIAKSVFQVHGVDAAGQVLIRRHGAALEHTNNYGATCMEPSSAREASDPTSWSHPRPAIAPIRYQPSMPQ